MTPFLFLCPTTGLRVQGLAAEDTSGLERDALVPVSCHACGGVHLINPNSEMLDADED